VHGKLFSKIAGLIGEGSIGYVTGTFLIVTFSRCCVHLALQEFIHEDELAFLTCEKLTKVLQVLCKCAMMMDGDNVNILTLAGPKFNKPSMMNGR
jgi:hypothetical protein